MIWRWLRAYERALYRRAVLSLILAPFVILGILWGLRLLYLEYYGPLASAAQNGELPF